MYRKLMVLFILSWISLSSHASTFTIVPLAGHALPTLVNTNEVTPAFYTVTNNTGRQLNGIYVAYLPNHVTQVTTGSVPNLCGSTFSLLPGGSCTLELAITGAVSSSNQDPHQHLFICLPGATTCSGTAFPLNVETSGWTDTRLPVTHGASIATLTTVGNVVYVAGRGGNGYPQFWTYLNKQWTNTEPIPHEDTGANASITTFNPVGNSFYLGVSGSAEAWIYQLNNGSVHNTSLPTGTYQGAAPDYWGPLGNVQGSAFDANANKLYVAGVGYPSAVLPNPPNDFSLFGGRLYYYENGSWSETTPSITTASFQNYASLALDTASHTLYLAGYGTSLVTGPMIGRYDTENNDWSTTLIIITADNSIASTINSIILDQESNLYAAGVDRNNRGLVWKLDNTLTWQHLASIPSAQTILDIAFDHNGNLYAAGLDDQGHGHVWSYNASHTTWSMLPMAENTGVFDLAFDVNNTLYALGSSLQYVQQVWSRS